MQFTEYLEEIASSSGSDYARDRTGFAKILDGSASEDPGYRLSCMDVGSTSERAGSAKRKCV